MRLRSQFRSTRRAWIELLIGVLLLVAAAFYWTRHDRSVSASPRSGLLRVAESSPAVRQNRLREREALRKAFIRQFGLPVGILANIAAENLRHPAS